MLLPLLSLSTRSFQENDDFILSYAARASIPHGLLYFMFFAMEWCTDERTVSKQCGHACGFCLHSLVGGVWSSKSSNLFVIALFCCLTGQPITKTSVLMHMFTKLSSAVKLHSYVKLICPSHRLILTMNFAHFIKLWSPSPLNFLKSIKLVSTITIRFIQMPILFVHYYLGHYR